MVTGNTEEPVVNSRIQPERRAKRRFGLEQELRYKMLCGPRITESGSGKTRDISSRGVWFSTQSTLPAGTPIELSLNWPVQLSETCAMRLVIYGRVVRSDDRGAAVAIERYEFHTQRAPAFSQPSMMPVASQDRCLRSPRSDPKVWPS